MNLYKGQFSMKKLVLSLVLASFGCVLGMEGPARVDLSASSAQGESLIEKGLDSLGVLRDEDQLRALAVYREELTSEDRGQYFAQLVNKVLLEFVVLEVQRCQDKNNFTQSCSDLREALKGLDEEGVLYKKMMSESFALNLYALYEVMKIKAKFLEDPIVLVNKEEVVFADFSMQMILEMVSRIDARQLAAWVLRRYPGGFMAKEAAVLEDIRVRIRSQKELQDKMNQTITKRFMILADLGQLTATCQTLDRLRIVSKK